MNTVCPGFVPHHVRPNRCRRCFKDIHDHNTNNEVSTTFTLPLPRRRRESVAVTETPKSEVSSEVDQSASFTITETTSLGRRTRQRSSSTSSWFEEKKINLEQKEKIDSLFRNADDSRASYKSTEIANDTDDRNVETVAVIRLPDSSSRRRQRDSYESQDKTKTETSKSLSAPEPKGQENSTTNFTKLSEVRLRSRSAAGKTEELEKPPQLPPKTLENRFDLLKKTADKKNSENKAEETKHSSLKLGPKTTENESLGRSSSFRSKFESQISENRDSKTTEKKAFESKFGERRPVETKFGEVRLRDTKFSEIRARASKFEGATDSKLKDKTEIQLSEAKALKTTDTKLKEEKLEVSKTDSKVKDTKSDIANKIELPKTLDKAKLDTKKNETVDNKYTKPDASITVDSKPKETTKPVLARFGSFKSPEAVKVQPVVVAKAKVPSSSSSEEESESEESDEPPPKPKPVTSQKEVDKKITVSSSISNATTALKTKPKIEPTKEDNSLNQ
ncbi:altered inheritance of mitochondria protein 21-like, partial [Stegodyphus dumicola]|uniref:altered inheritance of mitochondria protein 21-like n=1 Tax=Stegodyphus dumicola TaxID=202533 RepID=UPI0015A89729